MCAYINVCLCVCWEGGGGAWEFDRPVYSSLPLSMMWSFPGHFFGCSGKHQRRRHCPRSPDRCQRLSDPGHTASCSPAYGSAPRCGRSVRRRWSRYRHVCRNGLNAGYSIEAMYIKSRHILERNFIVFPLVPALDASHCLRTHRVRPRVVSVWFCNHFLLQITRIEINCPVKMNH